MNDNTKIRSIKANIILNSIKQFCALAFPLISITYANRVLGAENIGRFSLPKYTMINVFVSSGGNLFNIFYIRKKVRVKFTFKVNFVKHIIPLLILFVNNIASTIYLNSDITLLGILTDDMSVGIYSNASKSYSIIKGLINAAVAVLVPRFSYYVANGERGTYEIVLKKIIKYITVILIPISIGMIFEAEGILQILGGEVFISGAGALRILAIAMIPAVFACVLSYCVLMPLNNEIFFMISTLCAAGANIVLNFVFIPLCGIEGTAITTLIAEVIVVSISLWKARKEIEMRFDYVGTLKCIVAGCALGIICLIIALFVNNYLLRMIMSALIGASVYCLVLIELKHDAVQEIIFSLRKRTKARKG